MLSRTADHLFWMARYVERAENTARMLDVNWQMGLLPQTEGAAERNWRGLLGINEISGDFAKRHGTVTPRSVIDYMVDDAQNPSSIRNCLMAARENARAVRGTLTTEVWETQNQTWLEFQRLIGESAFQKDPGEAFEWVKFRSHLSRGVTVGTMLQDDAFHFLRIGSFLERADNTARLIDVKFHAAEGDPFGIGESARQRQGRGFMSQSMGGMTQSFGPMGASQSMGGSGTPRQPEVQVTGETAVEASAAAAEVPGTDAAKDVEYDFYHWSAVLRSVSAFEVYRKVYRNVIRPEKVAELLILRHDMPRSLAACLHEVNVNLQRVVGGPEQARDNAAARGPSLRRSPVRPHRRDPRDRPARLPHAVPRARQRTRRGHQPRLSGSHPERMRPPHARLRRRVDP